MKFFRRILKLKPADLFLKCISAIGQYKNIQSLQLNISKHLFYTLHIYEIGKLGKIKNQLENM